MPALTSAQKKRLKRLAQHLEPVVRIGKQGLSSDLIKSVTQALADHELIKVRFADHKEERKELAPVLAEKTESHLVTVVGNVAVLFREHPDPERRKVR